MTLEEVQRELRELSKLEPDWDSYGARSISDVAIGMSNRFLETVVKQIGEQIYLYAIVPIPDGGISLEWHTFKLDIGVDISPEGKLGYLLVKHCGTEHTFEEREEVPWLDMINKVVEVMQ